MEVIVSPMTITEIPSCADIYLQAFAHDKFSLAAFPRDQTPGFAEWWTAMDLDDFHNQPAARYIKAVIDERIVAFAKWNIPARKSTGKWEDGGGDDPDEMPVYPQGTNHVIANKFLGMLARKRRDIMGMRPHCYLEIVATNPEFQGRGAASRLIQWGLDIADELRLEAYLEGNEDNLKLYKKFGFETVDQYRLEELDYLESFMVRPAKKQNP